MSAGSPARALIGRVATQASVVNRRRKAAFVTAYASEHAVRTAEHPGRYGRARVSSQKTDPRRLTGASSGRSNSGASRAASSGRPLA